MNFEEYQIKAKSTAIYPPNMAVIYPALGLAGETGEVCEKVKKVYRDNGGKFNFEQIQAIKKELGDVLWYISAIASDLDISLNDLAECNVDKLFSRKSRGVLSGSGDER